VSQNNVPRVDLVWHRTPPGARGKTTSFAKCHCGQFFETPFTASS